MAATLAVFTSFAAFAQDGIDGLEIVGAPIDGALGFQPAATELARDQQWLDGMVLVIITAIVVFVTALLAYIIVRYNARMNGTPARFTHNSPLEVAWTLIPIVILVFIGAFSLPVLFKQQEIPEADITIKVTGYQWYWGYEYVDEGFGFDSYLLGHPATLGDEDGDVEPYVLNAAMEARLERDGYSRDEWLLATDNAVVVPIGKTIVMQVTGADVIHSWAMPAFGVKQDGVPGRLAELWFAAEREGIYFGQCSELCGKDHSYMPITVKVVSQAAYDAWLQRAKSEFAGVPQNVNVASND
ncbi:cytochrome c oxidase subunit II [Pseudohalocynthiibacter aestuariivivens]|nr:MULTISPECIES: cytochrome c oxidase subunit II [Pseudohalocynthiibacter]MBS9718685.1 cytochrome c oxidase subunit II [Pseudohalocynthiibacter aestuariivivens]MCK0104161.1 cytochrome c oxidase subunit II [Pseudohalocynthiibacter sp. F2068]